MNLVDLLIVALYGLIVAASFFGGLGRVIATLVGLYLATILAAFFYHPFSVVISFILRGVSPFTSDLVSFVVLLAVGTIAIAIALGRSFFLGRLPRLLGPFNNLSGMILGLLVALAATVLAATVISLSLEAIDRTAVLGGSATVLTIQRQMQDATLVPMFLKLAPTVTATIKPWFPKGLPAILAPGGP
jgi:hypothetical protein